MKLSDATVGSSDLDKSVPSFAELLYSQGISKLFDHPRGGVLFGREGQLVLGVLTPFDRKRATGGNGQMIAFELNTRAEVDAFHAKARSPGAINEGAPGERGPGFLHVVFSRFGREQVLCM